MKLSVIYFFILVLIGAPVIRAESGLISSSAEICFEFLTIKPDSLPRGFWQNQSNILALVKVLKANNRPLFLHELKNESLEDLQSYFIKNFGGPLTGQKIETVIRTSRLVPQWQAALVAVGHPKTLDERKLMQFKTVLKLRLKAKLEISLKGVLGDHSKASEQIYKTVFGEVISPEAFRLRVSKKYKSWELFLTDAGYPAEQFVERTDLISEQEVRSILSAIIKMKPEYDLSRKNIRDETSKEMTDFIFTVIGRRVTLKAVYRSAIETKTWAKWIEESGVEYRAVQKGGFRLTEQEIIKVIKHLYGSDYLLHDSQVKTDESLLGMNLVYEAIGIKLTVKNIYNASRSRGSWAEWIGKSGFDYRKIRLTRFQLTDDEIIKATRALYENNFLVNAVSLRYNIEPEAMAVIKKTIGFSLYPRTIFRIAAEKKPWFLWLSAAGLDVTKIQLSGKIPYKLVNRVTQKSLQQIDSNLSAMLGDSYGFQSGEGDNWEKVQLDTNDGESALIQKEFNEAYEDFSDELSADEQKFLQGLIDGLEEGLDLAQTMENLAFLYGPDTKIIIQGLFQKIKDNPKFLQLIYGDQD
jgi:hypothetical protein